MGLSLSAGVTTGGACVRTTSIDLFQLTYAPLLAKPGPCRSLQRCLPVRLLPSAQRSPANDQPTNFIAIQRSPRGIALNSALSLRHYIRVYIRVCMYVCKGGSRGSIRWETFDTTIPPLVVVRLVWFHYWNMEYNIIFGQNGKSLW